MVLALSWFPREEFAAALEAWPQLADGWGTADHTEYNRRLQRHLAEIQRHLAEMPTSNGPAWIAPIQVDRLRSWCARTGNDPASGSARSGYAAELARTAGMSRAVFAERFSRTIGMPPMLYLLEWRMAIARDLLRRERPPLAEVAERIGYQSASAFSTAFTRQTGHAPSDFARAGRV